MNKITVKIHASYTFWYYILKILIFLRVYKGLELLSNKTIMKIYFNNIEEKRVSFGKIEINKA